MSDPLSRIIEGPATWDNAIAALRSSRFEDGGLAEYLRHRRWFGGKAHTVRSVKLLDAVPLGTAATRCDAGRLAILEVHYPDMAPEIYLLPLQIAATSRAAEAVIARFVSADGECVLFDALYDESFRSAFLEIIVGEKRLPAGDGELAGVRGASLAAHASAIQLPLPSRVLDAEQSNSAVLYDDRFFLKLYRKPEAGRNPDAEILRFLSERQRFENVPAYCGAIEHRPSGAEPRVLALLVANVPNEGDAWTCTLEELGRFFERARRLPARDATSASVDEVVGADYLSRARQLGERTAQMHTALAAELNDPDFAPEPFTRVDQRSLYDSICEGARRMTQLLARELARLPEKARAEAAVLIGREDEILKRLAGLIERTVEATRIRHHGDYHLGQVLNTGRDFIIIDFEGEPARSLRERRAKRTPLRDVAGMLRSFHYAAYAALARLESSRAEDHGNLEAWAELWVDRVSRGFLDAYLATARGASFIPADGTTLAMMIEVHLLEKAAYEVCYELNNRPDWILIPVRGIARILDHRLAL